MESLIDKLKVKPIPKTKEQVEVKIPVPQALQNIQVKPRILDKRKDMQLDRVEIMKRVQKRKIAKPEDVSVQVEDRPEPVQKPVAKPKKPKEPTDEATIKVKKPRKLKGRKLKIVPITKGTISTHGVVDKKKLPPPQKTQLPRVVEGDLQEIVEGDIIEMDRIPKESKKVIVKAPSYYMNNREIFVQFINLLFKQYRDQILQDKADFADFEGDIVAEKCQKGEDVDFSLLTHQKIVRDYLNLYTPYRGLLLYHGLGSGKTCSSIAIAEGMKTSKRVIIMTPASLRRNYIEELKYCGDPLYKKNQFWEFVSVEEKPGLVEELHKILSLSKEFIRKNGGAWLVNIKKRSNYESLGSEERKNLEAQLNEMIREKYQFINYNGLRTSHLQTLTGNWAHNPFDNCVIIIDEAHNFISRIVNKLKKPESLSFRLYEYLMSAENCRIVLLTGTPIINYPNEIGILYNILRGYFQVWNIPLNIKTSKKINEEALKKIFASYGRLNNILDFVEYKPSTKTLSITRNPFGFVSKFGRDTEYDGVTINERGNLSDEDMMKLLEKLLNKNKIEIFKDGVNVERYKALPDDKEEFQSYFIDSSDGDVKNIHLFQRRIIGLTSYFRSAQEQLMPDFDPEKDLIVAKIPMSNYQFGIYESARVKERKLEKNNAKRKKKGQDDDDAVSTYRIFSRAFCNFVFPRTINRPMPHDGEDIEAVLENLAKERVDEDILDAPTIDEKLANVDGRFIADDEGELKMKQKEATDESYEDRIKAALDELKANAQEFLTPNGSSQSEIGEILSNQASTLKEKQVEIEDAVEAEVRGDVIEEQEVEIAKALTEADQLEKTPPKSLAIGGLQIYSPKFLQMLSNIVSNDGLHLIYSQFRTLEGIGIFKLILEANGFAHFKLKKNPTGQWIRDIAPEDLGKPTFAFYTGTEEAEEKEIIRNVYNGTWEYVPSTIREELEKQSSNNQMGEIIKVLMITAAGAEGISLRNCRFVHITEPYWHPVRIEQVIGRARRICSHQDLPPELRNVKVFLYLMTFSDEQLSSDETIELRLKDKSKVDKVTPLTSDEALYEISNIKNDINKKILMAVKQSAIDCALHSTADSKEPLVCYSFGANVTADRFSYYPSLSGEEKDTVSRALNKEKIKWKASKITWQGKSYALRKETGQVYDYDSYKQAIKNPGVEPIEIGKLEKSGGKFKLTLL